eukprot:CAMPEP_0118956494 /NCGR_PEP_ID=MMETSP1169-20130426/61604_1 /TAXON_ID=36882 /ORGANISM="Pyramimonas obovata, Strain CCMP722" /LENGTH=224 /DNA_ID=CAMNT_0006904529 /DNA_START=120 /DNA_END=791 /DNA_ORIENTATION=+
MDLNKIVWLTLVVAVIACEFLAYFTVSHLQNDFATTLDDSGKARSYRESESFKKGTMPKKRPDRHPGVQELLYYDHDVHRGNFSNSRPGDDAKTHDFLAEAKYVVPYITGLGVNNQMWDFEAAALFAKATGRVLCLAPFLRFYLSATGTSNIPFKVLYDPTKFGEFTPVSELPGCRKACSGTLNGFFSFKGSRFPSKKGKELIHISAFVKNTKFRKGIPDRPIW